MYKVFILFVNFIGKELPCESNRDEVMEKPSPSINVYWNIPTFQCESHKFNFTELAIKFNIQQNDNDHFRGKVISILYDPGSFPAILKNRTSTMYRNGGVPQKGNLKYHLKLFEELVNELMPDEQFAGVGIIDFESWRPIYRQNFGTLAPYRDLSIQVEKKSHPFWPNFLLEKEASRKFEFYGQQFMEETLYLAKQIRPNATWGYYGYPLCFNMSPNNMRTQCPNEVQRENERIAWLFNITDNLYPSLYVDDRLNARQKVQMVEGRINEAHRLIGYLNKRDSTQIIPYFWYKYHDSRKFLRKDDLFSMFTVLAASNIDGLVLWGSSNDVNTWAKCSELYQYINEELGPLLNIL